MLFFKISMEIKKTIKKLVTHNGSFHTDDIFACAVLSIMLEKEGQEFEIIRTRDEEIIKTGDYVFDVGGVYDAEKNRFDHHQVGGAGKHDNGHAEGRAGIEYASFGLVWKKFGVELCGSTEIAELINNRLVAPVDAFDNGLSLVENKNDISPYLIQDFFRAMRPTWKEENINNNEMFLKSVSFAKEILLREIICAKDAFLAEQTLTSIYKNTGNKKIIILDKDYPCADILKNFSEPLYVIYPRSTDGFWGTKAIRDNPKSFKNRKDFPKAWAGLRDEELQKITGVADAVFCHRGLFMVVAKSKEGAIKLAQIAVES